MEFFHSVIIISRRGQTREIHLKQTIVILLLNTIKKKYIEKTAIHTYLISGRRVVESAP